ncbi:putative serine/threonine-protein kinase YPL150W [[Candida] anglica]
MNGKELHSKAQLAASFNDFYLQTTAPGFQQIGNYQITSEIGEGAFGKVYLARHVLLNVQVVLKCGSLDDPNIVREIYYHKQLKHKHIVKLYEVIKTESHLWMVLEYCEGNELYYHIYNKRRLDPSEVRHLFYQIVVGVQYVHSLHLCHRDLKLENILLADTKHTLIKLTDFGFVREFNPQRRTFLSTVCGTTVYMAPEMLTSSKYSGFQVDVWSLGVILYTMLYGEMPFDEDDDMSNRYRIVCEEPKFGPLNNFSTPTAEQSGGEDGIAAIELIKKMLTKDPKVRATIPEILNSDFLFDLHHEKIQQSGSSMGGGSKRSDNESIISISQHYNSKNVPFSSKIERQLLKSFAKLNINTDQLQHNIMNNETNTLTALYELALTREYKRKKIRYYKEKKRRYKEARKSLQSSKRRVKNALGVDPNGSSQPLERILSSLSLSSRGGESFAGGVIPGATTTSANSGRPASLGRRSMDSARRSFQGVNTSIMSNSHIHSSGGPTSRPLSPKSHDPSSHLQENPPSVPPTNRSVSFHPDHKRIPSGLSILSEESLKRKKPRPRIFDKLQFWKTRNGGGSNSVGNKDTQQDSIADTVAPTISNTTKTSQKSQSPEAGSLGASTKVSSGEKDENKGSAQDGQISGNYSTPRANSSLGESGNATSTPPDPAFYSSSRLSRTRPSSVISQASQLSHLSQLSTMMSESEMDILEGTDSSMVFEYYDDDDRMYESSVNNSHNDFKQLLSNSGSNNTVHTSGPNSNSLIPTNQPKSKAMRKRPSYRRTMSSDVSILSSSTSNTTTNFKGAGTPLKKARLSQVSSNASITSEDSSSRSVRSTSLYDPVSFPAVENRPVSPEPGRYKGRPFRIVSPLDTSGLPRSHSPPITAFAFLKRNNKTTDTQQVDDRVLRVPKPISAGPNNRMFETRSIIDEEEEDEQDGQDEPEEQMVQVVKLNEIYEQDEHEHEHEHEHPEQIEVDAHDPVRLDSNGHITIEKQQLKV